MFVADRRTFMPNAKKGRFEEIAGGGFLAAASWWGLDEVQQAPEAGRVESDVALLLRAREVHVEHHPAGKEACKRSGRHFTFRL